MPELVIEDLTVRSTGAGRPILSGVSLAVQPREFVALVGGSGSGKTMTARSVLQLLPQRLRIESGSIRLGSLDVASAPEAELNRIRGGRLGMLFQQPKKMFNPNKTIRTHLLEPLKLHGGLKGKPADAKVLELLAEVGFEDPQWGARAYPHQLSGGMAQRAMTAMALAGQPETLLADEPTSALDKVLERQILQLLDRERSQRGLGILYITHNLASVAAFADRVLVMDAGKIVESGTTEAVLGNPKTTYTQQLLEASNLTPTTVADTTPPERSVLTLTCVVKHFGAGRRRGRAALDSISLDLKQGEILGVLGQSGSGKSTLARAIVGLEGISSGSITRTLAAGGSSDLLQRLHRDRGLTLMVITHDMDVVRHMCQRVAVLFQGRLVELTDTHKFFADPQHEHSKDLVSAAIPCRGLHLKKMTRVARPRVPA